MKKFILGALAIALATPVAAADYRPVGPQFNVPVSMVDTGGWSFCYAASMYTQFGTSIASTLSGCTGTHILLGAIHSSAPNTLVVLAQTTAAAAFAPTGAANNNVFTTSNGADWFYNDNWSWGFKPVGAAFSKDPCSTTPMAGSMCIVMSDTLAGQSVNTASGQPGLDGLTKIVFTGNFAPIPAVPEPSSWMMLMAGFGLAGAALRRRRAVAVSA